ncbi:glycoside hydrolase family 127 protein [Agreia pratensis]|uniref:glycoside hydrolase family 127 protein n=1 Tax=Agreia pratensis TaxID=150121 RepID=UPI00188C9E09|nr:beta-L-arabinofuranosidase domain-containing protein [Agreia pratensis]MBF4635108.1 glycoside hydrolase family 127 protein [Agreia pratensis]
MTLTTRTIAAPVVPTSGALRPLGIDEVRITGGFWHDRQQVNGEATLAHIEHWLEKEGWLANFDRVAAGSTDTEGRRGREFSDSEIYKYLEAVAWEIGRVGDSVPSAELETRFRAVVDRVAAAQDADGYLNTRFGHAGQQPRWSELEWGHELYCLGHLFQAAVARERTAPGADDGLLGIARRAADLIVDAFGADGIQSFCGHPEVEVGLAELGRVTGDRSYLELSALFVERRGHQTLKDIEFGRAYFQDDIPVRDATVLRGHAVRANYLAAGAVDIAVENSDAGLVDALKKQWQRTVDRRTYVTGGQGSHHQDEAFGEDWELPSDRAYSETCAGIASIMFSWRLLLEGNDARYADLIERTLFNVVATSPSAAGTAFFYANTLHQRTPGEAGSPDEISPRALSSVRAPWFEVSCCPPNVARTFASLAAYVATVDGSGLQLHQFAPATIDTVLGDGRRIAVEVETDYPRSGRVVVRVVEAPVDEMSLSLRVPSWAAGATLLVGGSSREVAPGYATETRVFSAGDVIELNLPMRARFTRPDSRIDAIRGSVAVERGPEVFALESSGMEGLGSNEEEFSRIEIDDRVQPAETGRVGEADAGARLTVSLRVVPEPTEGWPYAPELRASEDADEDAATFTAELLPYHSWGNRGTSTMRIWLPTVGA